MDLQNNQFNITDSTSHTIKSIENLILNDVENGRYNFINLIRDYRYQFDTELSYRMLNYYTKEGMLDAKRFTNQGKRRFSFFDVISLHYLTACRPKTSKFNKNDFEQLLKVVMRKSQNETEQNNITQFELKLLSSLVTLGIQDVELKTRGFSEIKQLTKPNYGLSIIIREKLRNYLKLDNHMINQFITLLVFEIDRIRHILKLTLICPENIQLLPKVDFVALFHIENVKNSIEHLLKIPIYKRLHDFTYIFKDDFGILYGVEIMKIGKEEFIAPEDKVEYQLSIEDILRLHNKI